VGFIEFVEGVLITTWFCLDFAMSDSSITWIARLCFAEQRKTIYIVVRCYVNNVIATENEKDERYN
jgi:hypothetical protein